MALRTPARILTTTLFSLGLALGGCSDSGGGAAGPAGGTPTPQDTNTADLTIQDGGGGAATPIQGTSAAGAEGTFGATIAGTMLNIWITSSQGALLSAVIDTSVYNVPGSATMGEPTVSDSFVTVVDPMAGTRTSTGGAIVIDQCPKAMGEAFTGKFDNVAMVDAMTGAASTLTGTFNLKVLAKAGDLVCKVVVTPTPDAGSTDAGGGGGGGEFPGAGQASCSNPTCDGPCCPYIPCLATCTVACETGVCLTNPMDFMACVGCLNDCISSCEVSQACITAAQAVSECEANNGCDELDNDDAADACLANNCCSQLQAAY